MTIKNALAGFKNTGLIPHDLETILSKLDIKLQTLTLTGPPPLETDLWVSQTPHNPTETISQSEFIQNKIANHQRNSPTTIFSAIKQLTKSNDRLTHQMTLLIEEVRNLRKVNTTLSKRRRAKCTCVQDGGTLSIGDTQNLIAEKEVKRSKRQKRSSEEGDAEAGPSAPRRCGNCGKIGHNVRTCQEVEEASDEDSYVESDWFFCIVAEKLSQEVAIRSGSGPHGGMVHMVVNHVIVFINWSIEIKIDIEKFL